MAEELIVLDTSVLIDYFRRTSKQNTTFYQLVAAKQYTFAASVITEYEIYVGATLDQQAFWDKFFAKVRLLDFDSHCAKEAVEIQKQLKKNNQMIAIPDLLIGSTAKNKGLRVATTNTKHFKRIAGLQIVDL